MKLFASLAFVLALPIAANAVTPLWLRDVAISPDGAEIAFTYKGDIWKVPTAGGEATRLTSLPSYEANPIWSPDGSRIAFASDRHGNFDVFVMPAKGGEATRLTYNSASEIPETFTPDSRAVMFSASIQDPATSALFPSSRMTELYQVSASGKGNPTQVLGTPALMVNWSPDGDKFLYHDEKGMENEWRKHHTSSVTRDVWLYDSKTGKHINLTDHAGEDRNPVFDGNDYFYFLSERDGRSMNVFRAPVANPSAANAITAFSTHPVRFLSRAYKGDGTLCFTYDGEIYTLSPRSSKPQKVNITITSDIPQEQISKLSIGNASEIEVSPDGKSVALIYRGDVFVTSVDYSTTKQITSTPEAECDLSWSPDSKSLIYTSERDGRYNIYKATMARPDEEINFANATKIIEEPLFKADSHERTAATMSPDSKQLAFILDRNKLMVKDMKSGNVRQLTDGSTYATRNGRFPYRWSPDSKWIALEIVDRKHDPYTDVAVLEVETGKITNLTNSAYFDESPRWAMDGNAIVYLTDRYGMRNHASWGSLQDAMIVFLNQEAFDKFNLSKEDFEIFTELEKKNKKNDKKDEKSEDSDKDKDKDKEKDAKSIVVDFDGIDERVVRLTPNSSDMRDAMLTADGETLYYLTSAPESAMLWKVGIRKPEFKLLSKTDRGYRAFQADKSGKTMFLTGSKLAKFEPKSDKITPISYSGKMKVDHVAERQFMFDNMAREEKERFYVEDMHGVNWEKLVENYRKLLPHINNNYDYAEMLSEILGELNVSHTGGRFYPSSDVNADRTASLGLLYDLKYTGNGLRVAEVIEKGPAHRASSKIVPGVIVEKINGEEITPTNNYTLLLNDIAGKKTLVSLYNPNSGERWEEVITPESASAANSRLYNRWVKQRAADVDRWSNGRLGYVHIASMNDASFRPVYADLLGKYNDREGVVIDIRWNGGGRLHEDVEVLFSGKKYLTQEIRGTETCDMPSRRWNKPSIMLMCEADYSNAHGTPWVYKHMNLGRLVGMPVAGTMTSVNWVTMQDPSLVYGIPVIGYRTAEGNFLENSQLEPDVKVANDPATVVLGEDKQLKTAVEELLREIDSKK